MDLFADARHVERAKQDSQGRSMFSSLSFVLSLQQMNQLTRAAPEQVERLQHRRLRRLLRYAAEHSLLYRDRFRGIDLKNCHLSDLPPLTKAEGMGRFDEWMTETDIQRDAAEAFIGNMNNAGKLFQNKYVLLHTSGSQGQPTIVVQTPKNIELTFLLQSARSNTTGQTGVGELVARYFSPARLAVVTLKRGFYPTAANFDFLPRPLRRFLDMRRFSQTDSKLIEELNEFSPTIITGYGNVLLALAEDVRAGRLRFPHLRHLLNNSEQLTDESRLYLMESFGVPVLNLYATGECGHLTAGCPTHRGAHVNADWAILEVVDDRGEPVPAGAPGAKVYLTNLANYTQPFIRYEVTDRVTMADSPCACGSRMPRVERIEGRATDSLWVREGNDWKPMNVFVFKHALEYCSEVLDWQVRQTDPRQIHLSVALLPGRTLDEQRLRRVVDEQLQMYGFHDKVQVTVDVVSHIPVDPHSGKRKRVICTTGPNKPSAAAASARVTSIEVPVPMSYTAPR